MDNSINPQRRKRARLPDYDYSSVGAYFVTICTHNRKNLFGNVTSNEMCCNDSGHMVAEYWSELEKKFPGIEMVEHVVMPNHFHGIIVITEDLKMARCEDGRRTHDFEGTISVTEDVGAALCGRPYVSKHQGRPHRGAPTLSGIVDWFKTMTTNAYIRGVRENRWPAFHEKLWQRSYYERVIRNEIELNKIRAYILCNPAQWALDWENVNAPRKDRACKSEIDAILKD